MIMCLFLCLVWTRANIRFTAMLTNDVKYAHIPDLHFSFPSLAPYPIRKKYWGYRWNQGIGVACEKPGPQQELCFQPGRFFPPLPPSVFLNETPLQSCQWSRTLIDEWTRGLPNIGEAHSLQTEGWHNIVQEDCRIFNSEEHDRLENKRLHSVPDLSVDWCLYCKSEKQIFPYIYSCLQHHD